LAICHQLFPEGVPTLGVFAAESGVATSTFRRAADWLLEHLPALLRRRVPGPAAVDDDVASNREDAVKRLTDLYRWLQSNRGNTGKNACYSPEAKQRLAAAADEIRNAGALSFAEIAEILELNERQLRRIREEVGASEGAAPVQRSRRPHTTKDLAHEIQVLIKNIQASGDSRDPYTAADVRRIVEKNYREQLLRYHGSETISEDTVRKYMHRDVDLKKPKHHPRGNFVYPEPFQQVAIDTSHFKVFGFTFYLITILDLGSRLNLVTKVFLRENTDAVVSTLQEYLESFPGLGVVVIDRGTPYLNEVVNRLLESWGKIRLVCPRATPTAKAACERHFGILKPVLFAALSRIFPQNPRLPAEQVAKIIEMGIAVFQTLYHKIPQKGIDGLSPSERASDHNAGRAYSQLVELYERALHSEPVEEIAGEIHDYFQLAGPKKDTARRLRHFGGRVLRKTFVSLRGRIDPPHPSWLHDPIGYIVVQAKKTSETMHLEYFRKQSDTEEHQQRKKKQSDHLEHLREREQNPHRFVDKILEQSIHFMDLRIPGGVRIKLRELEHLLELLAGQMGRAFRSEITRLQRRVEQLTESARTRQRMREWLETRASSVVQT